MWIFALMGLLGLLAVGVALVNDQISDQTGGGRIERYEYENRRNNAAFLINFYKPEAYWLRAIQHPQGKNRGRICRYRSPD